MKTHPLLAALSLAASLLLAGSAGAATLPVINPVSIEINGHIYHVGDTVTVTGESITLKVTVKPYTANRYYFCEASLSADACVRNNTGTSREAIFNIQDADGNVTVTAPVSVPATNGQYQIVFASPNGNPFLPALEINGISGSIPVKAVIPHHETLSANGNALASTGKLAAATSQSLTASVTASSADQSGSGQVYVAANLPASFGTASGLYFMDSAKRWAKWNGSSQFPAYKTISLASAVSVDMGSIDLTGLTGTTVYVGYGVGAGAAADADVLTGKYSSWMVQ